MNEGQFRTRFRDALGEPPPSDLRRGLEARLTAGPSRHRSSVLGPLAATLALVAIASAVGWRLVYQRTNATSTVKQSTLATPVIPTAAAVGMTGVASVDRSEEHTSELQSRSDLVC